MHPALTAISQKKSPGPDQISSFLTQVMSGEVANDDIRTFLLGLNEIGPTLAEITASAEVMRKLATKSNLSEQERRSWRILDTCGTGGDGSHTVNLSTLTALGMAALELDDVKVAKHGNRAVSSVSGSADLLQSLGIELERPPADVVDDLKAGIGFFFAPVWHPAMRHVGPVRKEIGVRTIFNILGPLANPVPANYQIVGVFEPELLDIYAAVLKDLNTTALVVHGVGNGYCMDEIVADSGAKTEFRLVSDGKIEKGFWTAADFKAKNVNLAEIQVKTSQEALARAQSVLDGVIEPGAYMVALQMSAFLFLLGAESNLSHGYERAISMLSEGRAGHVLEKWQKRMI